MWECEDGIDEVRWEREMRKGERDTVRAVRAQAMERDQGCRFPRHPEWPCDGPLEIAHLESHRRAKTGGKSPEERHPLEGVAMLCRRHHRLYDGREIHVIMNRDYGSNGYMVWMDYPERDAANVLGTTYPKLTTMEVEK